MGVTKRVLLNLIYSISFICLISTSVARADMELIPEFDKFFNISGVVQDHYSNNSKIKFLFKERVLKLLYTGRSKLKRNEG